jgi:hexosaminidase
MILNHPNIYETLSLRNILTIMKTPNFQYQVRPAYSLEITTDGYVTVRCVAVDGAFRALATFSQLFYVHSEFAECLYTPHSSVIVMDSPLFEHIGLNLDVSRNRISPKDVMRTIEAMSFNKLNRLHLLVFDAKSWPIEIPALPELASKGCYHRS